MSEPDARPRLLILCPTEYGGHIWHAAELAAAASRTGNYHDVRIISRKGATAATSRWRGFEVLGVVKPERVGCGVSRAVGQLIDTSIERRTIRALVKAESRERPIVILHETTRHGLFRGARNIVFVHNASPHHEAERLTLRQRYLERKQIKALLRADAVAAHGESQARAIAKWVAQPVRHVPLPGSSVEAQGDPQHTEGWALCLGEVRPNKGIDVAISAARETGCELVIAGEAEPTSFAALIRAQARDLPNVDLRLEFQSDSSFADLLERAAVVLLPYSQFDAQSGILARAMQAKKVIVASELPSLVEQAGHYPLIRFIPVGDVQALAEALAWARESEHGAKFTDHAWESTADSWDRVATSVLA